MLTARPSVCITSILRMTTLDFASMAIDRTSGTLSSTIWTTVEANTAIICACLPVLRTAATQLVEHMQGILEKISSRRPGQASSSVEPALCHTNRGANSHTPRLNVVRWQASRTASESTQHIVPSSEESMIPMGLIAKRTEIDVHYDDDCSSSAQTDRSQRGGKA